MARCKVGQMVVVIKIGADGFDLRGTIFTIGRQVQCPYNLTAVFWEPKTPVINPATGRTIAGFKDSLLHPIEGDKSKVVTTKPEAVPA